MGERKGKYFTFIGYPIQAGTSPFPGNYYLKLN
jgi:hypothetical protein